MKKYILHFNVFILIMLGISGLTLSFADSKTFKTLSDFEGGSIACQTGAVFDAFLDPVISGLEYQFYNDLSGQAEAVKGGRADAIALDEPIARLLVANQPQLVIFPEVAVDDAYGFGLKKGNPLLAELNAVLAQFAEDGTADEIAARWFSSDEGKRVLPELSYKSDFDGSRGTLRFGYDPIVEPMVYSGHAGSIVGYDVDILARAAYELNMEFELVPVALGSRVEAVNAGTVDVIGCCMSITEERKKAIDFTESYYKGGIVLVVRADRLAGADITVTGSDGGTKNVGFAAGLKDSFNSTFIVDDRYMLIVKGLAITLIISVAAAMIGTLIGFVICLMRRSNSKALRALAISYVKLFQGMPMVVVLMILAYVVFRNSSLSLIAIAIIGFAANFAAYSSEMMKTGIDAIDKGQIEAANALGFSQFKIFQKLIFPQATRMILPVYKGELISMIKNTSIVGYIAIQDLTKASDIIRSRTYEAFFPLLVTAIIYFFLAHGLAFLISLIEIKIDPKQRKRSVKGESR